MFGGCDSVDAALLAFVVYIFCVRGIAEIIIIHVF